MADAARDAQLLHQPQEPAHRPGRFDAHDDRRRQAGVELPDRLALVLQRAARPISPVSRSNIAIVCWLACKSHPIIRISASFDPSAVRVDTAQSTRAVARPTSL